jgi:uncharacterized protein (DUF1697 family)
MAQTYIVFLRGINVGGAGKLPMTDLRTLCERAGLAKVRTHIQSGNVICESSLSEPALVKTLDNALAKRMGKRVPVAVRTVDELRAVVAGNPFPKAEPAKVGVLFPTKPVGKEFLAVFTTTGEEVRLGKREVYYSLSERHGPDEAQAAR